MHLSLHSLLVVFCDFDHDIEDKYKWRIITDENYSVINESKNNEHREIKDNG